MTTQEPDDTEFIPATLNAITVGWLTRVLRRAGILKRATVVAIEVQPIAAGSGFLGQTARLIITYDEQEAGAPASFFVKLSSADPAIRQQLGKVGLYETEAGFYRDVALRPDFPMRVPRPDLVLYNKQTCECLLLLEDLGQAEFGDNLTGCSSTDAIVMVRQLGRLHAHFWDAPFLKQLSWLRSLTEEAQFRIGLYRTMLPRFEQRCGAFLTPHVLETAKRFAQVLPTYIERMVDRPQTLTHGDFRADNFAFITTRGERGVTVFDWQVARRAPGPRDLAYLLALSLTVEQRRATEASLLKLYHGTLVAHGVGGYSAEDLRSDVGIGLGSPLTMWVIAGGMLDFSSERGTDLLKRVCERLGAALDDHQFISYLDHFA
jgi:hypothetical protein